jgi:hypothetical protein
MRECEMDDCGREEGEKVASAGGGWAHLRPPAYIRRRLVNTPPPSSTTLRTPWPNHSAPRRPRADTSSPPSGAFPHSSRKSALRCRCAAAPQQSSHLDLPPPSPLRRTAAQQPVLIDEAICTAGLHILSSFLSPTPSSIGSQHADPSLQPNPSTQAHQLALWSELILGWAKHDRVFSVNVDSPEPGEVFANTKIQRECGVICARADARPPPPSRIAAGPRTHG